MTTPLQINNAEEDEIIEVPLAEYEMMKAVASGIAEQNATVLKSIKDMGDILSAALAAQAEQAEQFKELLRGLNLTVNVPEFPAFPVPIVNFTAPEQPPSKVTVMIPDKKRTVDLKVQRNGQGLLTGVKGTVE